MCRASLAALTLLAASSLAACGMRYSGSHSGGKSFTTSIPQPVGVRGVIGSLQADLSYSDYTAHSYGATFTVGAEQRFEDYDFEARIFQDLDGDEQYTSGADRLLAKSEAAIRDTSSRELRLSPIAFGFKPRHEPVGICWVVLTPEGEELTRTEMFR